MNGTGSCNRLIRCSLTYCTNKVSQILLWQAISGQGSSLQFSTALQFHQVYGSSCYPKSIIVDYLVYLE